MSSKVSSTAETVCPRFHSAVELIGRRWSGAILCVLVDGDHRFADIARAVPGLSDRLLSARLRELEAEGLVERLVGNGIPVKVTYRLTEKGWELEPAIRELRAWADRWLDADNYTESASRSRGRNGDPQPPEADATLL